MSQRIRNAHAHDHVPFSFIELAASGDCLCLCTSIASQLRHQQCQPSLQPSNFRAHCSIPKEREKNDRKEREENRLSAQRGTCKLCNSFTPFAASAGARASSLSGTSFRPMTREQSLRFDALGAFTSNTHRNKVLILSLNSNHSDSRSASLAAQLLPRQFVLLLFGVISFVFESVFLAVYF